MRAAKSHNVPLTAWPASGPSAIHWVVSAAKPAIIPTSNGFISTETSLVERRPIVTMALIALSVGFAILGTSDLRRSG